MESDTWNLKHTVIFSSEKRGKKVRLKVEVILCALRIPNCTLFHRRSWALAVLDTCLYRVLQVVQYICTCFVKPCDIMKMLRLGGAVFAVLLFLLGLPFCLAEGGSTACISTTLYSQSHLSYSVGDDARR